MKFMQENSDEVKKFTISTAVEKKKNAHPTLGQHILTQEAMSDSKAWSFFQLFPSMMGPHELKSSPNDCSSHKIKIYIHIHKKIKRSNLHIPSPFVVTKTGLQERILLYLKHCSYNTQKLASDCSKPHQWFQPTLGQGRA
jgi:hypothetical protein